MSDLLDEATRLAGVAPPGSAAEHILATPRVLRALVEWVRAAEAERQEWANLWQKASMSVLTLQDDAKTLTRERDAARGKLDKARRLIPTENPELIESGYGIDSADVLAILDGNPA